MIDSLRGRHWWHDIIKPLIASFLMFFAIMTVVVWVSKNIVTRLLLLSCGLLFGLVAYDKIMDWKEKRGRVSE